MKENNYSIRISDRMKEHLIKMAKEKELLPSEYLRLLIERDIEREKYHGKIDQ